MSLLLNIGLIASVFTGINCLHVGPEGPQGVNDGIHGDLVKIVGGQHGYIEKFPYIVSVMKDDIHACGGLLVRLGWVLTAYHCLFDPMTSQDADLAIVSVQAGMSTTQADGYFRPDYRKHPFPFFEFDPTIERDAHGAEPLVSRLNSDNRKPVIAKFVTVKNQTSYHPDEDIVLLMLRDPFKSSDKIRPPLQWPDAEFMRRIETPGTKCTVAGWGWRDDAYKMNPYGPKHTGLAAPINDEEDAASGAGERERNLSEEHRDLTGNSTNQASVRRSRGADTVNVFLNYATSTLRRYNYCSKQFRSGKTYPNSSILLCVSTNSGGACSGDSGGPLICDGRPVGIHSFGSRYCGTPRTFSVAVRLDRFLPWINATIDTPGPQIIHPVHYPRVAAGAAATAATERASVLNGVVTLSALIVFVHKELCSKL